MYPAILLMVVYIVFMICMDEHTASEKKIFSRIAFAFACLSAGILSIDYFVQLTVIQPSLIHAEYDAIGILTQYNPHGIFIALEELGYVFMSISFLFMAPVFSGTGRIIKTLRIISVSGFLLTALSFTLISLIYGVNREYYFEIAVISIDYIILILFGILIGISLISSKGNH
jgi:hypothetical protein